MKRPAPDSTPTIIAASTLVDGLGTGGTGSGATKYTREEETEVVSEIVLVFEGEVGIVEAGYATLWTLAALNGIGCGLDGDGQVSGVHFTITG
jgi:cysteine synthase